MRPRRTWNPEAALPYLREHELLELKLRAWEMELEHPAGKYYTSDIKRQINRLKQKMRHQPQDSRHPNVPFTRLRAPKATPEDWERLANLRRKLLAKLAEPPHRPVQRAARPLSPAETLAFRPTKTDRSKNSC